MLRVCLPVEIRPHHPNPDIPDPEIPQMAKVMANLESG